MTILTLPTSPAARDSTFGPEAQTQEFTSPLSRTTQTVSLPGRRWRGNLVYPRMGRAEVAAFQKFFMELDGKAGRFYGYDPDAIAPRGTIAGAPVVDGAGQTGVALAIRGATPATTLKVGDYLAYDVLLGAMRLMHMVTVDATFDGAGEALVSIRPPIRISPADGAAILTSPASCVMMVTDDYTPWNANYASRYGITIPCVEALIPNA